MVDFEFSVSLIDDDVHEFDLGDIKVSSDDTVISSSEGNCGTMMIFISLSELLYGISSLLKNRKKSRFEFVGTDSSFRLLFEYDGKGSVSIFNSDRKRIDVGSSELFDSLGSSVRAFYDKYCQNMNGTGAAKADLESALDKY